MKVNQMIYKWNWATLSRQTFQPRYSCQNVSLSDIGSGKDYCLVQACDTSKYFFITCPAVCDKCEGFLRLLRLFKWSIIVRGLKGLMIA